MDQTKKIEERLRRVEQKQDELSDTQKEIIHLVNKVKKDSFSIKGSPMKYATIYSYYAHLIHT